MDNGFNQTNNILEQDPNAFAGQPFAQPDPNAVAQTNFAQPDPNAVAQTNFAQPDPNAMAQTNFAQPDYNAQSQLGYAQTTFDPTANQTAYGWNNVPVNQFAPSEQTGPRKCPGKEITGMVFGISSLLMGLITLFLGFVSLAVGAAFGRHSVYGYGRVAMTGASAQVYIYGIVYGLMGIAFAVVAMVLRGKVMAEADEITVKIKAGFGLAIAGIITSGLGLFLTIIGIIVMNA